MIGNDNMIKNPIIDNVNCFVAYLELHDFKEWMKNWKQSEIKEQYLNLFNKEQLVNNIIAGFIEDESRIVEITDTIQNELFLYSVSNGIVLAINDVKSEYLDLLICICCYIKSYLYNKCSALIKGGLSSGCFFGDGMIAFGEGLINAYECMLQYNKESQRIILKNDLLDKLNVLYNSSSADQIKKQEKLTVFSSSNWNYRVYKDNNVECNYIDF